jgi:hypothetical protein
VDYRIATDEFGCHGDTTACGGIGMQLYWVLETIGEEGRSKLDSTTAFDAVLHVDVAADCHVKRSTCRIRDDGSGLDVAASVVLWWLSMVQ